MSNANQYIPSAGSALEITILLLKDTYATEPLLPLAPACFLLFASSIMASNPFKCSTTFFSAIILSKSLLATSSSFLMSSVWMFLSVSGAATAIVGKHAENDENDMLLSVASRADAWTSCNRTARGPGCRGTGACGGGDGDGEVGVLVAIL